MNISVRSDFILFSRVTVPVTTFAFWEVQLDSFTLNGKTIDDTSSFGEIALICALLRQC